MYDMPRSSPNKAIKKMMGNWNMKTLAFTSYTRSAKIWIEKAQEMDRIDTDEARTRKKM